jgi:hypothetical protein
MRFFASGPDEVGFLAVGQVARGFIAIGQAACGVVAIGQGAVGFFAIGQGTVGVFYGTAMIGVAGRKGWGGIVPLIPSVGYARIPPPTTSFAAVQAGSPGWLATTLGQDPLGLGLFDGAQRLPIKLDCSLQKDGRALLTDGPRAVFAETRREGDRLVCGRVVYVPERPFRKKGFVVLAAFQMVGLIAACAVFWVTFGDAFVDDLRPAHPAAEPHSAAPASHGRPAGGGRSGRSGH